MEQNPNKVFFRIVTPSKIMYVILLAKNGKSLGDQKKRQKNNPGMEGEKKQRPLFTCGEGKKRIYGKTTWNMEGLDYFYTVEKNSKDVYNTPKQFSALVNGWERWEPDDKTKKDPLRTRWRNPDDKNSRKKGKSDINKGWWDDEEDGYSLDKFFKDLDCDYDFDEDVAKRICNKVLGDSLLEVEAKYTQEEEHGEEGEEGENIDNEQQGDNGEENTSSKVIDAPLSVVPDRPQQERRAGTKYKK
jgi:hypothetical protein